MLLRHDEKSPASSPLCRRYHHRQRPSAIDCQVTVVPVSIQWPQFKAAQRLIERAMASHQRRRSDDASSACRRKHRHQYHSCQLQGMTTATLTEFDVSGEAEMCDVSVMRCSRSATMRLIRSQILIGVHVASDVQQTSATALRRPSSPLARLAFRLWSRCKWWECNVISQFLSNVYLMQKRQDDKHPRPTEVDLRNSPISLISEGKSSAPTIISHNATTNPDSVMSTFF